MQISNERTHLTTWKPKQNRVRVQRLAVFAVAALFIALAVGVKPGRVARATSPVQAFNITGGTPSPTDNDYTRIKNPIAAAMSSDTIMLEGTFDWTEANAAASWALGNDGIPSAADDYSIMVPPNLNNVTLTASSLGVATIQGPGDLAGVNLEGVLVFNGGDNQGWTISNIRFLDFDLSIGFFNGAGGADAFNNTKIQNNYIRIAQDLNATVAPTDVNQNIGIHFSFGTNQTISGNMIDFAGNGVSDGANSSSEVGMQSNSGGGNTYDGLQITNNVLQVVNAQSANPEILLGIWENGFAHSSNITVSGNQFINLAMANDPATNVQRGFRVTSHSSATTTVKYQNNTVRGANIGFQWVAGANFAGNQPVRLISNDIFNNGTGVLVQSSGTATLSFNRIHQNTVGLNNNTVNAINAENNWWGCSFGPGSGGTGCAATANSVTDSGSVDFDPWLVLRLTAVPGTIFVGGTSTLTADLTFNSDAVDTHLMGTVPDGIPVQFFGNAFGTVAPPNTSTISGKATSSYTGTAPGTADVSTLVDAQTVTTPITVIPPPCTITCPANITKPNDPNQCGAVTTYPAPTTTGSCGTVTCTPASGSFFPKGTTTVTCTSTAGPSCTFSVTVNDTQPPTITCPSNISAPTGMGPAGCNTVTYTTPTASDNCGATVACAPASGTCFPVGTTTVTCTATDAASNTGTCTFTVTVAAPCSITCPANITKSNDPNQCGAVTTYPAPTTTGTCGTVTCTPASGSFFPVGTTTVTCTASGGPSCTFTVKVNDTQPPTITCPANKTAKTATASDPCVVVTFTTTASDNCPGVTVVCNPPSGSCFPVGTTTVTCTATDASSNTATCSFTVTVFNVCIQDDGNPANVFLGNTVTGAYRFCCGGTVYSGVATVTRRGNVFTFQHNPADRRVQATDDEGVFKGTASLQSPPGTTRCTIGDKDTRNNSCICP